MTRQFPHVAQISFFNDPKGRRPEQLLEAWPTLVDVAEAASRSGVHISIVQASCYREQWARNGVHYCFLPFGEASTGARGRKELGSFLRGLGADLFHIHGLGFPRHVLSMEGIAPGVPIILQDHADRVPRIWRRASWRRALARAVGIAFCASEQAQPFADANLLGSHARLYEIPESTSRFSPGDREEARRITGIEGQPAVLWVGRLDENKDPLTVLEGIGGAAFNLPGLKLYCCFTEAPLLGEVRDRVSADSRLRKRVHLLGRAPHETIELLMRAADLFVLGSHKEGSGYSLIEALACGLPPVVTDIPSFRLLTGSGAIGRLWSPGDSNGLRESLESIAGCLDPSKRRAVRAQFDRELSFEALGAKLAAMYTDVLDSHGVRAAVARKAG